jgi:hypothetical protein
MSDEKKRLEIERKVLTQRAYEHAMTASSSFAEMKKLLRRLTRIDTRLKELCG